MERYNEILQREAYVVSQNLHDLLAASGNKTLDETRLAVSWDTLAPYLALTEQVTRTNVYLVDTRHRITGYFDGVVQTLEGILLPAYMEQSIALGFMGKTPFGRSGTGPQTRLTTSAPIMDETAGCWVWSCWMFPCRSWAIPRFRILPCCLSARSSPL